MMLSVHSDDHFMGEALKQAHIAYVEGEVPIGAVVVAQNRIIARAYNQVEKLNDVTAHAEMLAITAAENHLGSKYLDQCRLFVTLEPCTMCAGATFWAQVAEVIIGADDPKRGYSRYEEPVMHPKTKVKTGIRSSECKELIDRFFSEMRREH